MFHNFIYETFWKKVDIYAHVLNVLTVDSITQYWMSHNFYFQIEFIPDRYNPFFPSP